MASRRRQCFPAITDADALPLKERTYSDVLREFMASYQVDVYQSQQLKKGFTLDGPVLVGRRDPELNDPPSIALHKTAVEMRLVVVEPNVKKIPRLWFRMSCDHAACLVIENLHALFVVALQGATSVAIGETRRVTDEVVIELGDEIALVVRPLASVHLASDGEFRLLDSIPPTPGEELTYDPTLTLRQLPNASGKTVVDLLRVALQVVQKAAGSDGFFQKAVEATTQIVELDRAVVVMRSDAEGVEDFAKIGSLANGWCIVAQHLAPGIDHNRCPAISSSILTRVDGQVNSTIIHDAIQQPGASEYARSLLGIHCVVASPILSTEGQLIGVLYGDRWSPQGSHGLNPISELEATLVEVLAGAVAGGVARKSEERRRSNLSGFFSPRVADLLATRPELLSGQDANISVLFCDIRGFSSVTEKLGPQKTIEWINDVLSELSQCVVETDGVLVDYVGDELMAMWGAPGEQPDHAKRAIQTAIAMLHAIDMLTDRWSTVLPQRFGAGIGVNTGPARVGNVGSRLKFKYGVLGNTVNVGSRLQAATKQLEVDCLISRQTATEAGCVDRARRLAKLAVLGIEESLEVYQLIRHSDSQWEALIRDYQIALTDYEAGNFSEAARRLGELIQRYPTDRPCRQLLARAAEQLNEPSTVFSPVWKLSKK